MEKVTEKIQATFLNKYGVPYPAQNKQVQEKMWRSYKEKTGYSHPSHNPDVRSKSARSSKKDSKFELRVATLLEEFNIKYIRHYMLTNETCSHEFDFYIQKRILRLLPLFRELLYEVHLLC